MTERAEQLQAAADGQLAELIDLLSALDDSMLQRPCPGREKLGDGTVAANAQHTADNYQRIAAFVQTSGQMSAVHQPTEHGAHRIPGFVGRLGHRSPAHDEDGTDPHGGGYTGDSIDAIELVKQLSASRAALGQIAALTDSQLAAIPPDGSFRFCDGRRTLAEVLASLLTHQMHQVQAVKAAFT
jgi:hypothetical protein